MIKACRELIKTYMAGLEIRPAFCISGLIDQGQHRIHGPGSDQIRILYYSLTGSKKM